MRIITIFISCLLSLCCLQANASERLWSLEATALTGYYQYDTVKIRDSLPKQFESGLDLNDLVEKDTDFINYSIGVAYQIKPRMLLKFTFIDDIEIDPILQDFCIISCLRDNITFDIDMKLYEFDIEYLAYQFNPNFSLFINAGIVVASMTGQLISTDNLIRQKVGDLDEIQTGGKFTLGFNWHINDTVTLSLGHQRHSLFSMNKTYFSARYHF